MIEPTDEMVEAWRDGMKTAAKEAVQRGAPLTQTKEIARAGLAAVLAIVERDYAVSRRRPEHPTPRPKGYLDACGWCKAKGHACPVHVPVTWS